MAKIIRGAKFVKQIETQGLKKIHELNIINALANYGREVKNELIKVITTGSRTGRVYRIKGISHQASAPGEAPANLTGRLANSFNYRAGQKELSIFSNLNYSLFLENGTYKIKPRPYFVKTNEENTYKLTRDLNDLRS